MTFTPKEERFDKLTKFASTERFSKLCLDADLPYKKKLGTTKSSDFEIEKPKGVRFGKERTSVAFLLPSSGLNSSKQHYDYKPEGKLFGKVEVKNMQVDIKLSKKQLFKTTDRLKFDVKNVGN